MPQLQITTTEQSGGGGLPTTTGTLFVVGAADMGPPPGGPSYVRCQSITEYINAFGPRSATSAHLYDYLDNFFKEGGQAGKTAYVCRVEGNADGTTASLTLLDTAGMPTVEVTALTPGTEGNRVFVAVTDDGAGDFTIELIAEDDQGNQIAQETHGPYATTADLFADQSSTFVAFTQAAGTGNTQNDPANLASRPLSGGTDPTGVTDASFVAALANFPASLGPGTVALAGFNDSVAAWEGIRDHVNGTGVNRWGLLDMADESDSAAVIAAKSEIGTGDWSRCFFIEGSPVIPGVVPNTTRVVPGSSTVAALAAQVSLGPDQAVAPCGQKWGLTYALTFTQYFGPPTRTLPPGKYSQDDVNAMSEAGINCFANFYGTLCLFGFVTPLPSDTEQIYDQATAARERMALVADCEAAMAPFLFDPIDANTIDLLTNKLNAVCLGHYNAGALYGATAQDAFVVNTGPPINTDPTAQAKQLNAQILARITRYADDVAAEIAVIPVTVSLPAPQSANA